MPPNRRKKHFYICDKKYNNCRRFFYIDGMRKTSVLAITTNFRFNLYQNFISSLQLAEYRSMRQYSMHAPKHCFQFLFFKPIECKYVYD